MINKDEIQIDISFSEEPFKKKKEKNEAGRDSLILIVIGVAMLIGLISCILHWGGGRPFSDWRLYANAILVLLALCFIGAVSFVFRMALKD